MASNSVEDLPRSRKAALAAGAKHYFTQKPCAYGHTVRRFASTGQCSECMRIKRRQWRSENIEKDRSLCKAYKDANRDKLRAFDRAKYAANQQKQIARVRAYQKRNEDSLKQKRAIKRALDPDAWRATRREDYAKHAEKRRLASREWYAGNTDKARALHKQWCESNPDKVVTYNRNRRARKNKAVGSHTSQDTTRIRREQKDRCAYCKERLNGRGHLDHIVALCNGGTNWPHNLQWLCQPCNQKKHSKDPIEFARSLDLLL